MSTIVVCEQCQTACAGQDCYWQLYVCQNCGLHMKMTAQQRIAITLDYGSFKETNSTTNSIGIHHFPGYDKKLLSYQEKSGLNEAVITGVGKIEGIHVAIAVMDSHFMMGSMGQVVGEKITRVIELAQRKRLPLIIFTASGGARMQEGIMSLMQMAKTSAALARFSESGGFYCTVLTHPTTGGVSASFAMLGDIIIAEPQATIGFAGRRVIEKTINETLPDHFQSSEFLLEKGFIDCIVPRLDMKQTLYQLCKLHKESIA